MAKFGDDQPKKKYKKQITAAKYNGRRPVSWRVAITKQWKFESSNTVKLLTEAGSQI